MKFLGKLKLFAIGVLLTTGMTSCLKSSDPDFAIVPYVAYIEQDGFGSTADFKPMIQLYGNQPIEVTMGSPVCRFEGKNFYFEAVAGMNNSLLELTSVMNSSIDTVKSWTCSITATSKTEEPETASTSFSFAPKSSLGEFEVESLAYNGADNKVTGVWNKVVNAEKYFLVYRESSSRMWLPIDEFTVVENNGKMTANATVIGLIKDAKVEIAVAASNGTFWAFDGERLIAVGTDAK